MLAILNEKKGRGKKSFSIKEKKSDAKKLSFERKRKRERASKRKREREKLIEFLISCWICFLQAYIRFAVCKNISKVTDNWRVKFEKIEEKKFQIVRKICPQKKM